MRLTQEKCHLPNQIKDRNMTKLMSALLAGAFAVSLTAAAQTYPPAPATPATPATPAAAPAKTDAKASATTESMKSTGNAEPKKAKKKKAKKKTTATKKNAATTSPGTESMTKDSSTKDTMPKAGTTK